MKKTLFILVCVMLAISSVTAKTKVERKGTDDVLDLTGFWSQTDVDIVCEDLIQQCIESPRIAKFEETNGRPPVVIIGKIRNKSSEHIDTSIVAKRMQNAILKSGVLEFVSDSSEREALRAEKADQADHATEETAKSIDNEEAADFMLMGEVNSIVQQDGKYSVRSYYVSMELHDIQTNKLIWSGENDEVRKQIKRSSKKL